MKGQRGPGEVYPAALGLAPHRGGFRRAGGLRLGPAVFLRRVSPRAGGLGLTGFQAITVLHTAQSALQGISLQEAIQGNQMHNIHIRQHQNIIVLHSDRYVISYTDIIHNIVIIISDIGYNIGYDIVSIFCFSN
jgi:hypothetical protein